MEKTWNSLQLNSTDQHLDKTLSSLKTEKKELETFLLPSKPQTEESISHYSYIFPLVKEVHLLELKEKECKEEYENKRLFKQSQLEGQHLLEASLGNEMTVLKSWHKELFEIVKSRGDTDDCGDSEEEEPAVSTTSVESQEVSTVHDVVYNCSYEKGKLVENLAMTVLYQSVHVRIKIQTAVPCSNIHFFNPVKADVSVSCDTHIPGLEKIVTEQLENSFSIKSVISKLSSYMASDMAPFVISIPIRKKKKKQKDSENGKGQQSPQGQTVTSLQPSAS